MIFKAGQSKRIWNEVYKVLVYITALFLLLTTAVFVIMNDACFSMSKTMLVHSSNICLKDPSGVFCDYRNLAFEEKTAVVVVMLMVQLCEVDDVQVSAGRLYRRHVS